MNFVKFLRTPSLQNTPGQLFLSVLYEASEKDISFLDFMVTLPKKVENLRIYKVDRLPSVPHYVSSHPEHPKHSVVFSQTLRINRLYSDENDFKY